MSFSPVFESPDGIVATLDEATIARPFMRSAATRALLRFGGLTMDTISGAVNWRGKQLKLATEERELLSVMLKCAGQIVSSERLSKTLGMSRDAVEQQMLALQATLKRAGVTALPRQASGLGYVLWRA